MGENVREKYRKEIKEALADFGLANDSNSQLLSELFPERDPAYRDACERVERLDAILRQKMRREREVKRQRAQLESRIKEELLQLDASSTASTEEAENTAKFLALRGDSGTEAAPVSVFQTECVDLEDDTPRRRCRNSDVATGANGRDFVQRNIELAVSHSQLVAMTPEERARLHWLLKDLDERAEQSGDDCREVALPGEGYGPSAEDAQRMRDIDTQLSQLGAGCTQPQASSQSQRGGGCRPGERALAEAREERQMSRRLGQLNDCLSSLANPSCGHE